MNKIYCETKRKIRTPTYDESIKQRNIAILLIPLLLLSTIFFAILYMKDVSLYFYINEDNIHLTSDTDYLKIELMTKHNGVEYSFVPSNNYQKLPKDSILEGIRITSNKTTMKTHDYINYTIAYNFTFEEEQSYSNLKLVHGKNENHTTSDWKWYFGSNYMEKTYIASFFFNESYKNIKNFTLSFEFITNTTLDYFLDIMTGLWIYSFIPFEFYAPIEMGVNGNYSFNMDFSEVVPSIMFMNNTNEDNTTIDILFEVQNKNKDFDFNITSSAKAWFWKEITESSYSNTTTLFHNEEIEIKNSLEITENEYRFVSIVNISNVISFGSWIHTTNHIIVNEIIIEEKIHYFTIFEKINLILDSWLGLRLMELKINNYDLTKHEIDYALEFTNIVLY